MSLTILKFTNVFVSIPIGMGAVSVVFVKSEFTDVFAPICNGKGALSVKFAPPHFTDVFVAIGKGNKLDLVKEIHFPNSLGLFYSAFTYYTGFKVKWLMVKNASGVDNWALHDATRNPSNGNAGELFPNENYDYILEYFFGADPTFFESTLKILQNKDKNLFI